MMKPKQAPAPGFAESPSLAELKSPPTPPSGQGRISPAADEAGADRFSGSLTESPVAPGEPGLATRDATSEPTATPASPGTVGSAGRAAVDSARGNAVHDKNCRSGSVLMVREWQSASIRKKTSQIELYWRIDPASVSRRHLIEFARSCPYAPTKEQLFEHHKYWAETVAGPIYRRGVPRCYTAEDLYQIAWRWLWQAINKFDLAKAIRQAAKGAKNAQYSCAWKNDYYLPLCGFALPAVRGGVCMALRRRAWRDGSYEQLAPADLRRHVARPDDPAEDVLLLRKALAAMDPQRREMLEASVIDKRTLTDLALEHARSVADVKRDLAVARAELRARIARDRQIASVQRRVLGVGGR